MSAQGTLKEECLYCHGGKIELASSCPWCGGALSLHDNRSVEVKRVDPSLLAEGNFYREFSSNHPHV